uniref:Uncharacterized protein n=1 Tax=Arundo donax TaxID=35708 RepID=A0A0A9A7M6_ARUDO
MARVVLPIPVGPTMEFRHRLLSVAVHHLSSFFAGP